MRFYKIVGTTDRGGGNLLDNLKLPHHRYDAPVINGAGKYKRMIIQ